MELHGKVQAVCTAHRVMQEFTTLKLLLRLRLLLNPKPETLNPNRLRVLDVGLGFELCYSRAPGDTKKALKKTTHNFGFRVNYMNL